VKNQNAVAIVVLLGGLSALLQAQAGSARAPQPTRVTVSTAEAPIFVRPDSTMQPLRMAAQGSSLIVLKAETGWYQVEFQDPQYGRRVGYIEQRFVQAPPMKAVDLSVPAPGVSLPPAGAPLPVAVPSPHAAATPAARPTSPNQVFQKAKLSLQVGDKTEAVDVIVQYDETALIVADKKTRRALKTLPYAEITGGEYSYAKSPRWKTAIFVSPLFLFTSGKKHWFLAQGKDDHALLHLDKENYRLVLAAFETKTGAKVETVADSK
jgi:hypothetical protein